MPVHRPSPSRPVLPRRRDAGFALVAVLVIVALLTVIVVAFLSKSRIATQASSGFSGGAAAATFGRAATNDVLLGLQKQISSRSENLGTPEHPFYVAKDWQAGATDMLPALDEDAKAAAEMGVPNFLESSASSKLASGIGTDEPAVGGQVLPKERWNAVALLTSAQNDSVPVPRWIYTNRKGPVSLSGKTASEQETQSWRGGALNSDFVIGRYAYRIYDLSGLIDLNVAGFAAPARDAARTGRKGSLAWLDFFKCEGTV